MSKFLDRVKELTQGAPRPMGFAPAAQRPVPLPLILFARADAGDLRAVTEAAYEGAEGVLVGVGPATTNETMEAIREAVGRAMWGGSVEIGGRLDVERLEKAGCDLALLRNAGLQADALTPEIDKLLEVEQDWPDALLRAVDSLPIAGVIYRVDSVEHLTIQQLIELQRVVLLVRKPLIASLGPSIAADSIGVLRDAGVAGIMVVPSKVKDFRAALRVLPPPKKPKERVEPLIPAAPTARHDHGDDEEDRASRAAPLGRG
ncbi:MAG: hypothetical protein EXR51_07665 [Dehalococcoidia bacterium]|nr:hypothetical protein [Dehalococcoidia bacterium]